MAGGVLTKGEVVGPNAGGGSKAEMAGRAQSGRGGGLS